MGYERALLATDLSANAEAACGYGAWFAPDAEKRIVRVVHLPERHSLMSPTLWDTLERSAKEKARMAQAELREWAASAGLPTDDLKVRDGNPKKDVASEATEWDADLIVVGHHGRGLVGRRLLGSTARAVLRHAPCDVLVVPDHEPPRRRVERVCVATDFYEPAAAAARHARTVAAEHDAELLALHIVDADLWVSVGYDDPRVGEGGPGDRAWVDTNVGQMLHEFNVSTLGGQAREVLRHGRPAEVTTNVVKEERVDLLVVGTHGAGPLERWMLGSVAESIVEAAGCPVLIVKARA